MFSKSFMFYEGDDYSVRIEYSPEYVILHLPYVNKFSKGVFQSMQCKVDDIYDFSKAMGRDTVWAAVSPDDAKVKKLLRLLDFEYKGSADGMNVYSYKGSK